jgi:steroid delta-isomerase-like uncharacterized protein
MTETDDGGSAGESTLTALASAYVDLWNDREYATISDLVSEQFVLYDPATTAYDIPGPDGEAHGRTGLRQVIEASSGAFSDFNITPLWMLTDGAALVVYEARLTGTHDGMLGPVPPTGRRLDLRIMSKLEFDGEYVDEHRAYVDTTVVLEQLGLTVPAMVRQAPALAWRKLKTLL